jgi:hypothetical protein
MFGIPCYFHGKYEQITKPIREPMEQDRSSSSPCSKQPSINRQPSGKTAFWAVSHHHLQKRSLPLLHQPHAEMNLSSWPNTPLLLKSS